MFLQVSIRAAYFVLGIITGVWLVVSGVLV